MNETTSAASLLGSLGGKARAARLTPEQRTEAARKAGKARQSQQARRKLIANAANLTVIDDGQFRYPVWTVRLRDWITANSTITETNYEAFCADVPCLGEHSIGTPSSAAMIDLCQSLLDAGATLALLQAKQQTEGRQ